MFGSNDFDANDAPKLSLGVSDYSSLLLHFEVKDQKAYRLFESSDLKTWDLSEDFGVLSGDHSVTLRLTNESQREFYLLEAYQPD